VRVAFALDCCDREAMSFLATTSGVSGEDVRDLMLAAVEHRFGPVNRLPVTIEWLSDNGSCYLAGETRSFARNIGLEPRTTPIESPPAGDFAGRRYPANPRSHPQRRGIGAARSIQAGAVVSQKVNAARYLTTNFTIKVWNIIFPQNRKPTSLELLNLRVYILVVTPQIVGFKE
jgi:transposase InsO family protein